MSRYKFNFQDANHFIYSMRKNIRKDNNDSFDFNDYTIEKLKIIYDYEVEYGEALNELGYRKLYSVVWTIMKNYNRDKFYQEEAVDWAMDIIDKIIRLYKYNKENDISVSKATKNNKYENYNCYAHFDMIDEFGILEGSNVAYNEERKRETGSYDRYSDLRDEFKKKSLEYKLIHGIYMFYNMNKELIYVGKSRDLGSRILQSACERGSAMYITLKETKTHADIGIYEMYYIAKLKPKLNIDGNTVDSPSVELPELETILEMYKVRDESVFK